MKLKVLFLGTDEDANQAIGRWSYHAEIVAHGPNDRDRVRKVLNDDTFDLCVIRGLKASDEEFELLQLIRDARPEVQTFINVGVGGVEDAVRFMKAGAADFIVGEIADSRIEHSILHLTPKVVSHHSDGRAGRENSAKAVLLGNNAKILEVMGAIKLVAQSRTAVMITGESGTGKDLVARMIHHQSDRSQNPFVALNCAAIPRDLIESELFGHERGAFTGAMARKEGCFELADGGSLFFDEIAEMNADTQAKLLRAIEHQSFRRLGGKEEVTVDVRALAATNKNIYEAMKSGEFREDLYYRFSVIEIHLPPLRERADDIPLLLDHFLTEFGERYNKPPQRFSDGSIELLMEYDWPGNVRELRNIVERCVIVCPKAVIDQQYLPNTILQRKQEQVFITIPVGSSARDAERRVILETLASVNRNKSKAARILGLSRKTLHNKLMEITTHQD